MVLSHAKLQQMFHSAEQPLTQLSGNAEHHADYSISSGAAQPVAKPILQKSTAPPFFLACFIDAHHFETINAVKSRITHIKDAAGDCNVLFLLDFATQNTKVWVKELSGVFTNGQLYTAQDNEDANIGQAVLAFEHDNDDTKIHWIEFVETPPDVGCVHFGKTMVYVELQFKQTERPGTEKPQIVGVLWAPALQCAGKPYLNDENWWGAIGFLTATLADTRNGSLSTDKKNNPICKSRWKVLRRIWQD